MPPGAVVAQYALDNKNGNFGIIHGHLRYWMLAGINSAILAHKYANYMLYQSNFMATQNARKKCQIHADFLGRKLIYFVIWFDFNIDQISLSPFDVQRC